MTTMPATYQAVMIPRVQQREGGAKALLVSMVR